MLHKLMETWYDTILYFGILIVSLSVFLGHWKEEYQIRYAEIVLQEFLRDVTVDGKITLEEYEEAVRNLENINPKFDVDINCTKYVLKPMYAQMSAHMLNRYYAERNVKIPQLLHAYSICMEEEDIDGLKLQPESNASVLEAVFKEYVPLPEEGLSWSVKAVKAYQEVYEGEELITVCGIDSQEGRYYAVAEPQVATASGYVYLKLLWDGKCYQIPVEVLCHPKIVYCDNGHKLVNSKEVIQESRVAGKIVCPYCKVLPERIDANKTVVFRKTGTELCGDDISITAIYMDGRKEEITPEMTDWLDTYDKNYCGIQQVTIQYRGKETVCTVVSENENCQNCGMPCNDRCHMDYVKNPYCLSCLSQIALFSNQIYEEEQWITMKDLTARLDETGELLLKMGDYVRVCLSNDEKVLSLMQQKIKQNGRRR